ncbi:natterin-3 [Drosophila busckii]|uniref:natterin-3 n=1 Tax=Drosophila busckii TaxID=30019 RepID=UPI00083F2B7A|nr:natterin-3 [Drosophila busckii]
MDAHTWLHYSNGAVPQDPIVAGHDSDGDTIFIGRAFYNNDMLPAKVIPNKGKAYVAYGGEEIELENYEVLSGKFYDWLPAENGGVPDTAVQVGCNVDGEALYAGRGYHAGSLTVGKVHPSHGCLYIPYGAEEIKLFSYEVLSRPQMVR